MTLTKAASILHVKVILILLINYAQIEMKKGVIGKVDVVTEAKVEQQD